MENGRCERAEVRGQRQDTGCQILDKSSQRAGGIAFLSSHHTSSHNLADLFKQNEFFRLCE